MLTSGTKRSGTKRCRTRGPAGSTGGTDQRAAGPSARRNRRSTGWCMPVSAGSPCTCVDNAGITRVKAVPVARLRTRPSAGSACRRCSTCSLPTTASQAPSGSAGRSGDLRLVPDLDRLSGCAAQPGWAWAPARPVDAGRYDRTPGCQRQFARAMATAARWRGLSPRMAFEIEWALGDDGPGRGAPCPPAPDRRTG